jgi:hypothetical protein
MDDRRWSNANALVEAIRSAEQEASRVESDYFHQRIRGPQGVSHPSEDEAKAIKKQLVDLRKMAAGIADREARS